MKRRNALAAALAFVTRRQRGVRAGSSPSRRQPGGTARAAGKATARAQATIAGEGVTGTADFVEMAYDTGTEVEITVTAKGLKPGLHGVHLHAVGKCEPPAFTAAGGHFDPGPAGNTDPDANHPYHMGDIPNLRVGADGIGHAAGEDDAGDAGARDRSRSSTPTARPSSSTRIRIRAPRASRNQASAADRAPRAA